MRAVQTNVRSLAQHLVSLLACGMLLCACAAPAPISRPAPPKPANTVVLLPDSDGKTGAVLVSGGGAPGGATDNTTFRRDGAVLVSGDRGEQLLSKPGQAVRIEAGSPPGAPFIMEEGELRTLTGSTRAALPKAPVQYLLYFRKGTSDLTEESRGTMKDALRTIKERGAVDISVVGHSDTVGDKVYNDQLSLKRAQAVTALLAAEGIDASVIETTSHGKDNPLIPTGDQVDEPRNRRVEVTIR